MDDITIRGAGPEDAPSIRAIYAPVVEATAISFEVVPPSVEEMARRVRRVTARYPWLVAESDREVIGYIYASAHSERAAYRWSVETSVYVAETWRGRGIGRALYSELIAELRALGYLRAFAGIALPNAASVALHEQAGFRRVGTLPSVGFKLGSWWDVGYWCLPLIDPAPGHPTEPRAWVRHADRPTGTSSRTLVPATEAERVEPGGQVNVG